MLKHFLIVSVEFTGLLVVGDEKVGMRVISLQRAEGLFNKGDYVGIIDRAPGHGLRDGFYGVQLLAR